MMFRLVLAAMLSAVALPATSRPQTTTDAWTVVRDRAELRAAKIGVPAYAGVVTMTRTAEFSSKGKAIDNFAQYESRDRKVFATAYVYRPTYADAALAAYATRQAVVERFTNTSPGTPTSVAFAGQVGGAIRQVFTGSLKGEAMITAAAFARAGNWLIKLRVSGPASRAGEVTSALDALLGGITVGSDTKVYPAQPLQVGAPCPAAERSPPKVMKGSKEGAAVLIAGLVGGSMVKSDKKEKVDPLIAFPANGVTEACVRGTMAVGARRIDLLQPAGKVDPAVVLAVIDDAGTVIAVEKSLAFQGYMVKRYAIGLVEVGARIDRQPTAAQLARWLATPGAPEMALASSTTVNADGSTQTNISPDSFK